MERKLIMWNYFKGWFALDLLASLPYSWIIGYEETVYEEETAKSGGNSAYKTPQLLRLLKIMRFIRILRLLRVLKL